ncbi:hypothetical protein ACCUM_4364 [Candidatus Accumulibacter phosphatis]|uniref:Uncharacterized protein n=1 Tax=Candidatus Accumulibacter phosphatis TaxID=327160 RepID=A0A5S4F6R6_9PROT|nr:hypothetical protein ACCUM_4364 [Candidatus Accumulibacter phosphatis]
MAAGRFLRAPRSFRDGATGEIRFVMEILSPLHKAVHDQVAAAAKCNEMP